MLAYKCQPRADTGRGLPEGKRRDDDRIRNGETGGQLAWVDAPTFSPFLLFFARPKEASPSL